ncbi:MAG: 2Fe-2S iron-sulfur cluster binding domain-containing protein [Saprospiraceae bacterium]|nr:2Fe-2S iron-sulfur cluster binding domain-containing protein [Saprospiraceae bacterium]
MPVLSQVTVILDGEHTQFELSSDGKAIVDAAIDAGVDAPWSCHAGVCCTCKARVLEGKVDMKLRYGLLDEEVADGYILTCQSHPLTETLVVDYDV